MLGIGVEDGVGRKISSVKIIIVNHWSSGQGNAKLVEERLNLEELYGGICKGFILHFSGGAGYGGLLLGVPRD